MPHKNIYLYFGKEANFWSQIHWRHRNPPGCHIKPANVHCCVYPPRSPPPHPDPLSSPSGILLFSWWKRLLGSCTNELALLLNDVCKLWPSLLPMNGAETQNPHRQLGAHSHFQQLVVELNRNFRCRLEFGNSICSSLALPCGLKTNIFFPFK